MNTPLLASIVVPTWNEQDHIAACLRSLTSQSLPPSDYEIIVVDNGSSDQTCEIVRQFDVRLLSESKRSAYAARNRAVENARGRWIAFTDGDCIADKDWLRELIACAESNQSSIVGGLTRYEILKDSLGNRILFENHTPERLRHSIEQDHCVAGGNMLVRRSAFESFGSFKLIRSGSDIEFSRRLAAEGHPACFAEAAIIRHQCDLSNWEYLQRSYRIRRGQRIHRGGKADMAALWESLRKLPWRPGFRAVVGRSSISHFAESFQSVTQTQPRRRVICEWLYRWMTRWAGFFGELDGAFLSRPSDQNNKTVNVS